jgi:ubiquinone biosynthesis protein
MKSLLISIFRLFYIPLVLSFYLIILFPFKRSYPKRLIKALELCGPVFIKLGQSISLKPYLFSKETVEACSNLQDKVSPSKVNLKKELGEFYDDFTFQNKKSIANGSIACVFEGFLQTGERVAIKILRSNAQRLIKADLFLLKNFSYILEFIKFFKRLKLRAVVKNIEESLLSEIDFRNEAENLMKIKANMVKIYPKAKTPRVFNKYTKYNLLVTEFVEGIALSNVKEIAKANLDINLICKNLIEIYLQQVYEDGFFHADFHPGNLFVTKKCDIVMIDFGIVSSISYIDRVCLAKILNGFLLKDYERVYKAHLEAGYIKEEINKDEFKQDLYNIGEVFIHSGSSVHFSISSILMELFRIMEKYKIEIKEDLLLLYKTIFFVEAVVMKLNPNYNIWHTIKPWMEGWKNRHLGLEARIIDFAKKIKKHFCG